MNCLMWLVSMYVCACRTEDVDEAEGVTLLTETHKRAIRALRKIKYFVRSSTSSLAASSARHSSRMTSRTWLSSTRPATSTCWRGSGLCKEGQLHNCACLHTLAMKLHGRSTLDYCIYCMLLLILFLLSAIPLELETNYRGIQDRSSPYFQEDPWLQLIIDLTILRLPKRRCNQFWGQIDEWNEPTRPSFSALDWMIVMSMHL